MSLQPPKLLPSLRWPLNGEISITWPHLFFPLISGEIADKREVMGYKGCRSRNNDKRRTWYRLMRGVIPTGLAIGNDRRIPTSELPIHQCPPSFYHCQDPRICWKRVDTKMADFRIFVQTKKFLSGNYLAVCPKMNAPARPCRGLLANFLVPISASRARG